MNYLWSTSIMLYQTVSYHFLVTFVKVEHHVLWSLTQYLVMEIGGMQTADMSACGCKSTDVESADRLRIL